MRSSRLGFVLFFAAAVGLCACGGGVGGGGSALAGNDVTTQRKGGGTPSPGATAAPAAVAVSGLARVQQFTYATGTTGESSSTVTLGTTGTGNVAPAPGHVLVALISLDDAGGSPVVTAPAGWNAVAGSTLNVSWVHQAAEALVVGATPPSSVTFTYNESVGALITIVEVANTAGVDVVTSAMKAGVTSPWTTSSGTGTQPGSGDLGLAMFAINDSILTPSALSGFTMLSGVGRHGNGTTNYGHTVGIYVANGTTATGAVPAQSITWAKGDGSESVLGEQILMKPSSSATTGLTPTTGPTPTAGPTPAAGPVAGATAAAVIATSAPVVPAIAAASCGTASLVSGLEYAAGWAPYSCTSSPWNQHVSSNPTYASYSSSVIATEFGSGNTQPVRDQEAGQYDYGHPIYYASGSDPVVTLRCTNYCNHTDNGGYPATAHVPALARPAGGSDAHMTVIQPDGTEIDMWATTTPSGNWTTGSTVTAQAIANCGSFLSGSGFTPTGPAATAGGACLGAGLLRANELLAGSINHALFLITQCAVNWQYPAFANASTDTCTSGQGPALGGRLWYDVADATTNANTALKPWEKAILNALHDYGGYLMDDIGGAANVSGIAFLAESGEESLMFGQLDPFAALAGQGWSGGSLSGALQTRWLGADPWHPSGVDFVSHLHWLDPCSARSAC
jgi:hypothetical protein